MLSEFLLSKPNLLEELFRIVVWGMALIRNTTICISYGCSNFKRERILL